MQIVCHQKFIHDDIKPKIEQKKDIWQKTVKNILIF